jgi:Holliday junction DNA helicase RuvA
MIAHLRGKLMQKEPARVIVDVHGVSYRSVPVTTFTALPDLGAGFHRHSYTHA